MKKFLLSVWIAVGCSSSQAPPAEPAADADVEAAADAGDAGKTPSPTETARFEKARAELEALMAKKKVPGAAFAVVMRGTLMFSVGLGVKKEGGADPVTPDSLFRVASMTKPIVTAGVLQQVEAGAMGLDTPLRKYLPAFDRSTGDAAKVKVRHLLSHTSGIPDEQPYKCKTDTSYLATWLAARNADPLWAPPGRLYNYSNGGFGFAAYALQEVVKQPFTTYLKERVLAPARMETATFEPAEAGADQTFGHDRDGKRIVDFTHEDCAAMRAYMGIIASAKDYAHFAETFMANDGTLVTPASLDSMQAPTTPTGYGDDTVGLGLFSAPWRDTHVAFHDGRATGWESSLVMVPAERLAVVVLFNVDDQSPAEFAFRAIDILRGREGGAVDYSTAVSSWAKYAGVYQDPFGWLSTMTVGWTAKGLTISIPDHSLNLPLVQFGGDSFGFDYEGRWQSGTFFVDASGVGEYYATRFGVAKRTPTSPPPPTPGPPSAPEMKTPAYWDHAHAHLAWRRP